MIKKILIVEDEKIITNTIVALLEKMGIEYFTANNGEDALEKFKTNKFDLIFTDIFMPKMDGFKLIEEIRKIDREIPIIVISGYIDNETIRKILELGANKYIEKPFSLKEIKKIIEMYGEKK